MQTAQQHPDLARVLKTAIDEHGGFLRDGDVAVIAQYDRQRLILVRCGCGRFLAPAQNVAHFAAIIEREGSDYVRDLSLSADDPIYRS